MAQTTMSVEEILRHAAEMLRSPPSDEALRAANMATGLFRWPHLGAVDFRKRQDGVWEMPE